MDSPQLPATPRAIRKPKELPVTPSVDSSEGVPSWTGSELDPLDLPSANTLLNFTNDDLSSYTQSQLYDLNQELLNNSVPRRPLIDEVSPMSELRIEYEKGSASFVEQIEWLQKNGFDSIRRTRGPPALAFAYVESLINSVDKELAVVTCLSKLASTTNMLETTGIAKFVYEDFYDQFTELVKNVIEPDPNGFLLTIQRLLGSFQNPEVSNSIVIYLRFLTSAQIRLHQEDYEGFLVHPETKEPMDVDSFCANIVQAMGKEADNVEIEALCQALSLNVDVAYLNGSRGDRVDFIKFSYDSHAEAPPLVLLYRPGHYDILLKKSKSV